MSKKPTHAAVTQSLSALVPEKENDVPRLYHVPRHPRYDAATAVVEQIVLSITPTAGVYALIGYPERGTNVALGADIDRDSSASAARQHPRPPRTLVFLHRPFTLDRRRVRRGTLVLASHTAFDERLTVGWNKALAERLGMDVGESVCIQGYKGDAERKIGIAGRISAPCDVLVSRIQQEFGGTELVHEGSSVDIRVVAVMNAFHEDEVQRVLEVAMQRGWIAQDDCMPGQHVLYLTGQPREARLEAAKALGMTVACVGHRAAEEWGIRYLAARMRKAFPTVRVQEVFEEEEVMVVSRGRGDAVPADKR